MPQKSETLTIGGETFFPQTKAAGELNKTVRTLENWRQRRIGPAWTTIGNRIYYRESALVEWLRTQERQPVAGEAA